TISPQGRPMIFYTSIGRGKSATDYAEQWAAIGDNDLYTWSRPTNNPVLHEHVHGDTKVYDWRDPFLFEHEGRHFLVTGGNLNRGRGGAAVVTLYEADGTNLLSWRYRGVLFTHPDPKVTNIECPNFFKLRDRWVLIISPHREVEYFVGRFDAEAGRFTSERDGRLDHSGHFYAPNSLVDPEGRRVLWGWVRGFPDGLGWNGCLTLPRVLALNDRGELLQESLPALTRLRGAALTRDRLTLTNATNVLDSIQGDALEIETHLDRGTARDVTLWVRRSTNGDQAVPVSWDGSRLTVDGIAAPVPAAEGSRALKLRVFVDKSVLEVYAHDRICLTRVLKSRPEDVGVAVGAREGTATVELLRAWPMRSIW
ncbi:MAG TPA: glycoside hydrolase family 32 protein, partial [Methylomirabilota bacterium]|nr:glycoside hydrolase family 32 protein [Methylomirabilota bacterium]